MPIVRFRSAVALAGATLLTTASAHAQGTERRTLHGDAAVYNVAGTIRVVASTGRDAVVEITPRGPDARKLRVEQGDVRGRDAVRVVFPDDDVVYPAMGRGSRVKTRVNRDGTFGDDNHGFFSSGQMQISGSGRGTEAWADVTVSVPTGQKLAIHLIAGEATVTNVDGDLSIDVHAASVTTDRTRGQLTVDAGSGRVRLAGAQGDINLDLGSGPVEVRDVNASRFRVDAGSGDLEGTNVTAQSIDLDLGSGGTRLDHVSARQIKVDAGSGSVDMGLVSDVDEVRMDVGSGNLTLRLPSTLGATLDVDGGSGGIETEMPIQVTHRERDHLTGSIGDGKGRIAIDGGSGKVRLLKN